MSEVELWAGAECSLVRLGGEEYVDQLERTGHARRADDLDRLAALGVRAFRQPVLWEKCSSFDWSDERLERLDRLGVRPIVGLVHHGSGPPHTSLLEDGFADGLAEFAGRVAERYPWVVDFTPVNEPLTTARFSALYGLWYPRARSDAAFARAVLVQCRAIRASMRAIRRVSPGARLVQTEDIATVFSTPRLSYQARFENDRRFLSLDLLSGRIDWEHALFGWLTRRAGVPPAELESFVRDPCPPDIVGINYYVTSDWFLDHRLDRYPSFSHGGNGRDAYADVEAVRARRRGLVGFRSVIDLVSRRYGKPVAVTEAHLAGFPEDQVRWLLEAWYAACAARASGVDVRAVTLWSAFGTYDWDSLLVEARGRYEPGVFDVRSSRPRPTALARVARQLAAGARGVRSLPNHAGWWRRASRLTYAAGPIRTPRVRHRSPLLVVGAAGTLGRTIAQVCEARAIEVAAFTRAELDATNRGAIERVLSHVRPWAVVNCAGYVRVDDAERDGAACHQSNVIAPALLADACAAHGLRFATFSSDLVFDGKLSRPYVETDLPSPLSVYGSSKARAEQVVLERLPQALVVRTSAFFGPADSHNFVTRTLAALASGDEVAAADDAIVSPTYVPDLAQAVVSLLVDGEVGVVHLATRGAISWFALAHWIARCAGVPSDRLRRTTIDALPYAAPRPRFSALASERIALMPGLDDAVVRYCSERREGWA